MKYETPNLEVIKLQIGDVITLSVEGSGSGDDVTGNW